jgi:uncharacterized protein (TIGR00270 family)
MEECELCGRQMSVVYVVSIEGVEFRVCANCAKGKKIVSEPNERKPNSNGSYSKRERSESDESGPALIDGYGTVIRNAREGLKIPIKVLAEMINEKETFLARVEEEKTEPPMPLVKKLEKTLNINLISATDKPETKTHSIGQRGNVTLGDYATK